MLRHRANADLSVQAVLLYASRSIDDVIYLDELDRTSREDKKLTVALTLTRERPADWNGYARRIDEAMLSDVLNHFQLIPKTYVCGPTALVEAVAGALVGMDVEPGLIRTERFGPSGT